MIHRFIFLLVCYMAVGWLPAQGTYPVFPNITDHSISSDAVFLGASGDRLVYFDKSGERNVLWLSDGTPEGTKQVSPADQTEIETFFHASGTWYFTERRGTTNYISILTTDRDTLTRIHANGSRYQDVMFWNERIGWIQNSAGSNYSRIYLFDPVADTVTTVVNLGYLSVRALGASDSLIYFIASTDDGKQLGCSDGNMANTKYITTLYPFGSSFDQQSRFFSNGKKVYFFYHPEPNPFVLWTSDGTADGTIQLGEFDDPDFGWPDNPAIFLDDKLIFILRELGAPSGTTFELHATDGTPEGTLTLDTFPDDYTQPRNLTLYNSKIYFISFQWGADLRATDGTLAGTEIILESNGHWNGSFGNIVSLGRFDDTLFLQAYEEEHGYELYKSNGTKAGTYLISDVIRGSADSYPNKFTQVGSRMFFSAEFANRKRLWIYDPQFTATCDSFQIAEILITPATDSTLGSAQILAAGGQAPYVLSINGGNGTYNTHIQNLPPGNYTLDVTDNLGCTVETTFTVTSTTAVLEPSILKSFSVLPNPSTADAGFTVQLDLTADVIRSPLTFRVHNLEGKMFLNEKLPSSSGKLSYTIQATGYSPGHYVMTILAGRTIVESEILIIQ